jgi:molecular chaperone GrpE
VADKQKDQVDERDEIVNEEIEPEVLDEKDLKIKELEENLLKLQEEINNLKKGAADVVNRNKQLEVDKKYASSSLIRNLLIPISYFEGALKMKTNDDQLNNFLKGFEMVYNLILEQLYNSGLKEITVAVDDEYDPKLHEVFEMVDTEDSENKIVEVIQKGYYFKDRVLKPVKVKVSQIKVNQEENNETESDLETVTIQ